MNKYEFLSEMLAKMLNNKQALIDLGVENKVLKAAACNIVEACSMLAKSVTGEEAQQKIPFQDNNKGSGSGTDANKTEDKTLAKNKPTDPGTKDSANEANKTEPVEETDEEKMLKYIDNLIEAKDYANAKGSIEAELNVKGTNKELLKKMMDKVKTIAPELFEKAEEKPVVDAQTDIKPKAEEKPVVGAVKDTINDPHASKRMTLDAAHDFFKKMLLEVAEKDGVRQNNGTERDKYLALLSEILPADDPGSSLNKDYKAAKKHRIGLLDEYWKEVNKERKSIAEAAAAKQEEKAIAQVGDLLETVAKELSTEAPAPKKEEVVPSTIPEKTLKVSADEVAKGSVDAAKDEKPEGKTIEMKANAAAEEPVDLATCTLADFKKALEKDYLGIVDEAEYTEESERFKKWEALVNLRVTMADSVNIIATDARPKAAKNWIKSQLGQFKKNNINAAKKAS